MHTPGPWITKDGTQMTAAGMHLAYIKEALGLGRQAVANEALRDAAPDMLAALKEAIHAVAAYKGRLLVSPIKSSKDLAAKAERLQRRIDAAIGKAEDRT
jgi:hypothetical protein